MDGKLVLALPPGIYKLCIKDEAEGLVDSAYYQILSVVLEVLLPPPPPPPSLRPSSPPQDGGINLATNVSLQGQTASAAQPNESLNFLVGAAGASMTIVALLVAIAALRICWLRSQRVVLDEDGVGRLTDAVMREATRSRTAPQTPSSLKSEVQQIIDDHQRPFPRGLRVVSDAERRSAACNILQSPQQSRRWASSRVQQHVPRDTSSGTTPQDVQRSWLNSAEAAAASPRARAPPQPQPLPAPRIGPAAAHVDSPSDADRRV